MERSECSRKSRALTHLGFGSGGLSPAIKCSTRPIKTAKVERAPHPERMGFLNEGLAQRRSLVVDADWDLNGHCSLDETIALQVAQSSRQRLLTHTFDTIH